MLTQVKGVPERFACKVVGLARSTYRRLQAAQTPEDPDAGLRARLLSYANTRQGHGFQRAWAALRFDEGSAVNMKRVHRLWRQEGLQVREHHPRKRAGVSSVPPIEADAPKVVWALDFQFDSTLEGRAVTIASMIDEHTRERCCTWWNARSPPIGWSPSWSVCSPFGVRHGCCVWTTVRR